MPRRHTVPIALSPGQARYVLDRLVRDRVISPKEVSRYVADMQSEISSIEARLNRLRQAMSDGPQLARPSRPASRSVRRKPRVTPRKGGNAGKQLGGRFAGLIRRLPVEERQQYHEIKAKEGVQAAISALQKRRTSL